VAQAGLKASSAVLLLAGSFSLFLDSITKCCMNKNTEKNSREDGSQEKGKEKEIKD